MPRLLIPAFVSLFLTLAVQAGVIRGVLLNDDEPYIIKATDGAIYKAEFPVVRHPINQCRLLAAIGKNN
jgi:hypothetical protein